MTTPDPKTHPTDWTTVSEWYLDREGKKERCRRQPYSFALILHEAVHFGFFAIHEHPRSMDHHLS